MCDWLIDKKIKNERKLVRERENQELRRKKCGCKYERHTDAFVWLIDIIKSFQISNYENKFRLCHNYRKLRSA